MDPLSVAASTFAIVQIADRIITLCRQYISGVRDAPSELRLIAIEVGSVKCVLEVLEFPSADEASNLQPILDKLKAPLNGCHEAFVALESLFPSESDVPVQGKRQRLALSLATLAWPFKRDRASILVEQIASYKATILLGLQADCIQDVKKIRLRVETIQANSNGKELPLNFCQRPSHFNDVLKWLVTTDPSPNHNRACDLHEEHTGQWLTKSPEYVSWKTLLTRALWIHGIPGAGKTVLFSHIVEDIRTCSVADTAGRFGYAYYYCDFARGQDETEPLLRWIISQLSRQLKILVPEVENLAEADGQPSISGLMMALASVTQRFARVFVLIDALDETRDRERLLSALLKIMHNSHLGNIQLLVASRKEVDIERELLPRFGCISLSNPYVDEDIRMHIYSCLREDSKLSRYPELLKVDIEAALVKGAQGMFRWVVCQMDNLKRLHTEPEVRVALNQLPKTLDETYERILSSIPTENQLMARTTLHLLSSNTIYNIIDLLDALCVDLRSLTYHPDKRPWDSYAPIEVCRCLVSHDPSNGGIRLAHYTVKEFLISTRIGDGPSRYFQTSADTINILEAQCYLVYMRDIFDHPEAPRTLLSTISGQWADIARKVEHRPEIQSLIIQLLGETRLQIIFRMMLNEWENYFPAWSTASGRDLSLMLTYLCYMDFGETTARVLDELPDMVDFRVPILAHYEYSSISRGIIPSEPPSPTSSLESIDSQVARRVAQQVSENSQIFWHEGVFEQYINDSNLLFGLNKTTLLHIAAGFQNWTFLKLFMSSGADINFMSANGFSVLIAALYVGYGSQFSDEGTPFSSGGIDSVLPLIEFLLEDLGADPSSKGGCITPLQLTAILFPTHPGIYTNIARKLLFFGADANGVACDTINQTRIRDSSRLLYDYLESRSNFWQPESAMIQNFPELKMITEKALGARGKSKFYDTPLRILEVHHKTYSIDYRGYKDPKPLLASLKELDGLLKSHGGRSLHLFSIKDLPGYCEEDMNVWGAMQQSSTNDAAGVVELGGEEAVDAAQQVNT